MLQQQPVMGHLLRAAASVQLPPAASAALAGSLAQLVCVALQPNGVQVRHGVRAQAFDLQQEHTAAGPIKNLQPASGVDSAPAAQASARTQRTERRCARPGSTTGREWHRPACPQGPA